MKRNPKATAADTNAKGGPMDASAPEVANTTEQPRRFDNHPRNCWAMDTLIAEVKAIEPAATALPEAPDEYNACLDVTFGTISENMQSALVLASGDYRVEHGIAGGDEMEGFYYISFHGDATTKDLRDPFNIEQAMTVLASEGPEGIEA